MRRKNTMPREQQRATILGSAMFLSGESFTRAECNQLLGLCDDSGAHLLGSMVNDGLVVSRKVKQGNKTFILYCKPPSKLLRMPWRKLDNWAIGIRP